MRHSKDGIDRFFDYSVSTETRTIWVGSVWADATDEGGTDALMAEFLIKGLHILSHGARAEEEIILKMSNLGGNWYHGMAMFDAIRACKAPVRIEAFGYCMSMGSILMQAADHRVMHPNSRMMVHDGSDGAVGHARNFEAAGMESKKIRYDMYKIYAERSGQPVSYWAKRCIVDFYLSAEEAVKEGLADEVAVAGKELKLAPKVVKRKRKRKI